MTAINAQHVLFKPSCWHLVAQAVQGTEPWTLWRHGVCRSIRLSFWMGLLKAPCSRWSGLTSFLTTSSVMLTKHWMWAQWQVWSLVVRTNTPKNWKRHKGTETRSGKFKHTTNRWLQVQKCFFHDDLVVILYYNLINNSSVWMEMLWR